MSDEPKPKPKKASGKKLKANSKPMDVHYHPELPSHGEKKKFKQYLLEGLMIFIAVTMGFFAESLREHINLHNKEINYVETFTQDLRTDSVDLCRSLNSINFEINHIDSLIILVSTPAIAQNGARAYYYARTATRPITFKPSDRTLAQLKNSGGFSLIKNTEAVDSITSYESNIDRYQVISDISLKESELLYPYIAKMFNALVFQSMVNKQTFAITPPAGNPQLIVKDPAVINEFIYYLHQRKSTLIGECFLLKGVQSQEQRVYHFLREEYGFGH